MSGPVTGEPGAWCGGHEGLGAEVRSLALLALDRLGPALDRLRTGPGASTTAGCSACPVCAVLAVLRGERPELAVRLAEQVGGVLAVLRAALEEGAAGPTGPDPGPTPRTRPPGRPVQRIPVERRQPAG